VMAVARSWVTAVDNAGLLCSGNTNTAHSRGTTASKYLSRKVLRDVMNRT